MSNARAMQPKIRRFLVGFVLVISCLVGLGLYRATHTKPPAPVEAPEISHGTPQIGGPFALEDTQGRTVTDQDFKGKWMWVYFGYTYCPDICPTALQAMGETLKALGPLGDKVQPLFITVDPKRDTRESLEQYHSLFHPRLIMLTGSKDAIQQAMKGYRVYAQAVKPEGTTDYVVDHTSFIYLMDPNGRYVTHVSHGTPPQDMVARLKPHLEKHP